MFSPAIALDGHILEDSDTGIIRPKVSYICATGAPYFNPYRYTGNRFRLAALYSASPEKYAWYVERGQLKTKLFFMSLSGIPRC